MPLEVFARARHGKNWPEAELVLSQRGDSSFCAFAHSRDGKTGTKPNLSCPSEVPHLLFHLRAAVSHWAEGEVEDAPVGVLTLGRSGIGAGAGWLS